MGYIEAKTPLELLAENDTLRAELEAVLLKDRGKTREINTLVAENIRLISGLEAMRERHDRYSFLANERQNTIRLRETERDDARTKLERIRAVVDGDTPPGLDAVRPEDEDCDRLNMVAAILDDRFAEYTGANAESPDRLSDARAKRTRREEQERYDGYKADLKKKGY